MNTEEKKSLITKYATDFESYSQWAQGMQMMLAMCLKAGMPLPTPDMLEDVKKIREG